MATGQSAHAAAQNKRERAARLRQKAEQAERQAEAWEAGAIGEGELPDLLRPLRASGYAFLGDRLGPGGKANIDGVLIGPTGVYVLDAKRWSGRVEFRDGSLRQDGRRRDRHLESLRGRMHDVRQALPSEAPAGIPLLGALCFSGQAFVSEPGWHGDVFIGASSTLLPSVQQRPVRASRDQVVAVARALDASLPRAGVQVPARPSSPVTPPATANSAEELPEPAPSPMAPVKLVAGLAIVTVREWRRHGKHRVYGRGADGADLGYHDVIEGDWHPDTTDALPILRLACSCLGDRAPRAAAVPEDETVLEALPQQRLVVAVQWGTSGRERLYVKQRRAHCSVEELGYIDLSTGRAHDAAVLTSDLDRIFSAALQSVDRPVESS